MGCCRRPAAQQGQGCCGPRIRGRAPATTTPHTRAKLPSLQINLLPRRSAMADFYADCVAPDGKYRWFLDGQWKESASGKGVSIINPTTNEPCFRVQGERRGEPRGPVADARSPILT